MLATVGQQQLHLNGAIFHRWGEVFHRHKGKRRRDGLVVCFRGGPERVPNLESGDGADSHHAAFDAVNPCLRIGGFREARYADLSMSHVVTATPPPSPAD